MRLGKITTIVPVIASMLPFAAADELGKTQERLAHGPQDLLIGKWSRQLVMGSGIRHNTLWEFARDGTTRVTLSDGINHVHIHGTYRCMGDQKLTVVYKYPNGSEQRYVFELDFGSSDELKFGEGEGKFKRVK